MFYYTRLRLYLEQSLQLRSNAQEISTTNSRQLRVYLIQLDLLFLEKKYSDFQQGQFFKSFFIRKFPRIYKRQQGSKICFEDADTLFRIFKEDVKVYVGFKKFNTANRLSIFCPLIFYKWEKSQTYLKKEQASQVKKSLMQSQLIRHQSMNQKGHNEFKKIIKCQQSTIFKKSNRSIYDLKKPLQSTEAQFTGLTFLQLEYFFGLMNEHQRHKFFTTHGQREPLVGEQHYATDFFQKNAFSPRKRNTSNEPLRKDHIAKPINDQINKLSNEQLAAFNIGQEDKKIRGLIIDAISSADRAIKAILPYGHAEIQKYCSVYFLNKEKLLSFLDANNRSFFSNSDKISKKGQKRKQKRKENGSSDLTEMVPINHLERLEKIVYNKIIPILQTQFETQKRKSQKMMKKGKEWSDNDLKQGLQLLQRLNNKERIAVDECSQILQKFIVRIMEKQQKMLSKIGRMQEKLDEQIKKTEILAQESKKWQEYRAKTQKEWNKQKKNLFRYEQFSKEIKNIFTEKEKIDSQASEKECLQDIMQQIKRMLNNEERHGKRQKKCDHKSHKETHANYKEEASKNEQQIKSLKEVVKSLDQEICILREECYNIDNKLQQSNEKASKYETKSKKIIQQNESMNNKIEEMMKQQVYKSKLIDEYLRMIARLQETLRQSQQNLIKLNEQNDSYLQLIAKHSSQKEDYIRQMMEVEERSKDMEEMISRKQIQIEELVHCLGAKEKQIIDNQAIIQKLYKEIQELYHLLKAKQLQIQNSMKEMQQLQKQLKESKQKDDIKSHLHKQHETSIDLNRQKLQKDNIVNIQTLESIQNPSLIKPKAIFISEQLPQKAHLLSQKNVGNYEIINVSVQEKPGEKLNSPHRQDFIPASVNRQTLADVMAEAQKNESENNDQQFNNRNVGQHEDTNRDIIPADVNNQLFEARSRVDNDYHEEDQRKHQQANEKRVSQQLAAIQAESRKIQQLLDLNTRIADRFAKLKEKMQHDEQLKSEVEEIKDQMEGLAMMLNMCKRTTTKKLQRVAKAQLLHQEAQQEIERLKHRLDDALITSQPFSNIPQDSDGSGFTIPDHLQSFIKNNIMEPTKFNQDYFVSKYPIKSKKSKDFFTQTDASVQTTKYPPNVIAIQSQVIIQSPSPIISQIEDRPEVDRSFINELADISPVPYSPIPRIQSAENSDGFHNGILTNSLKQTPIQKLINPQIHQQKAKTANSPNQIDSLIEYHKEQIINLHKMLRENADQLPPQQDDLKIPETPRKHPLDNQEYLKHVMNAPQKQKNQGAESDRQEVAEFHHQVHIEEMKEMFTQRQQQFSQIVIERQQEIERLKSIIKTLTKAQEVQEKASPMVSRNKEPINREIQNLKKENQQLWMFLEKQKSEIERLQILIKQYQLHEELHQLKRTRQRRSETGDNHSEPVTFRPPFDQNQKFIYTLTPARKRKDQRMEIPEFEDMQLSKSQNHQENNHELIIETEKKEKHQQLSPPKQTDSPTKRFARKSQKFQKQESPRERRHTSPKMTMQFDWQDLVPQYFGDKPRPSREK